MRKMSAYYTDSVMGGGFPRVFYFTLFSNFSSDARIICLQLLNKRFLNFEPKKKKEFQYARRSKNCKKLHFLTFSSVTLTLFVIFSQTLLHSFLNDVVAMTQLNFVTIQSKLSYASSDLTYYIFVVQLTANQSFFKYFRNKFEFLKITQ